MPVDISEGISSRRIAELLRRLLLRRKAASSDLAPAAAAGASLPHSTRGREETVCWASFFSSSKGSMRLIFEKSLLRCSSACWCAARCAFATSSRVVPNLRNMATAPLLPNVLPAPVATAAEVVNEQWCEMPLWAKTIRWVACQNGMS